MNKPNSKELFLALPTRPKETKNSNLLTDKTVAENCNFKKNY